jgi:uncharacterized protein (TIGR03435 family)
LLWCVGMFAAGAHAQTVDAYVPTMTFDVASVRQSPEADSYTVKGGFAPHSSSLRMENFDIRNILSNAYGIRWDQIVGMPDWQNAMFNIQAKSDSATDERLAKLNKKQEGLEHEHMLQTLLAERFNLKAHWEMRTSQVYELMVAKKGLKMQAATAAPFTAEELKDWGGKGPPPLYQVGNGIGGYRYIAHGAPMGDIVEMLAVQLGHPVEDKTGLNGRYDFTLRYDGARASDRAPDDMNPVPALDTAITDELGLKVEAAKGPAQFLVIDHIEKPSAN